MSAILSSLHVNIILPCSIVLAHKQYLQMAWYNFGALILDCITFPLGVVALAVPWRLPFVLSDYADALQSSSKFDLNFAYAQQFVFSVIDLITVPLGIFSLCVPWRTMPAGRAFADQVDKADKNWNPNLRGMFVQVRTCTCAF